MICSNKIVQNYTSKKMREYYFNLETIILKAIKEDKNTDKIMVPRFNETWLEYVLKEEFLDFGKDI